MKKYLAVAGIAAALALAVALGVASNGDDSPATAAGPELVAPDLVAGTDDLRSDDLRTEGDVNGELDEAGGLPPVEELPELESEEDRPDTPRGDRSAFLEDLRSAIESRSEELGERVVDLTEQRSLGEDIAEGVALLVDEVTVLGESIITGVAITPEALEAVPDLREIHQGLIDRVGGVHAATEALDPAADDDTWHAAAAEVLSALGELVSFAEEAV